VRKVLIKLLFALSLGFMAPVAAYASITLEQQRIEVIAALDGVIAETDAEIAAAQAALVGLDPTSTEAIALQGLISILTSRKNYVLAIQAGVPAYPQPALDSIIIQFDLAVSLS